YLFMAIASASGGFGPRKVRAISQRDYSRIPITQIWSRQGSRHALRAVRWSTGFSPGALVLSRNSWLRHAERACYLAQSGPEHIAHEIFRRFGHAGDIESRDNRKLMKLDRQTTILSAFGTEPECDGRVTHCIFGPRFAPLRIHESHIRKLC